ncbi:MAG: DegT/DnrJ/EryC1/StrS family aminotransferase [Spirochaetes bacterium]|nr:DegT/DnrJ/EryC1/StrS family aminotransferase [Spirochaetota bacterium]
MAKLAINGGPRSIPEDIEIAKDWPVVTKEDKAALIRVIDSGNFWGKDHPETAALEKEYAEYTGTEYCLAFNSGTSALHGCVAGIGIEPGDEVIIPSLTFLASATSVMHHNAIPVFVDIDPETYNIDYRKIAEKITDKTKAIMPVDYHGLPADYDEIYPIARAHDLVVIEDAAQAGGATYKGRKAGNLGDISGASTMPLKPLPGAGEGGLVCTNDKGYRDLADMVRMFGEIIEAGRQRQYNAYTMGWNYRMNPLVAAMIRSQLKRLDDNVRVRHENGAYISGALAEIDGVIPPYVPLDRTHAYYIYYFKVDPQAAGAEKIPAGRFRQAVQDILRAEGVFVRLSQHTPVPGQSLFQVKRGYGKGCPWTCPYGRDVAYRIEDYPNTLDVLRRSLALDARFTYPSTSKKVIDMMIDAFRKVFENMDEVVRYAGSIDYREPWEEISTMSPVEQHEEYVSESLYQGFREDKKPG